jgi:hypothetical protein
MAKLKTVLNFMLVGAFLGDVVAMLIAPVFMSWNNEAPLAKQQLCDLPDNVREITRSFIHAQLLGSAIGAVAFLVLGILFLRARARKQAQTPPPPAAPTANAA